MVAVGDRLFTGTVSNGVYFSDDGAITWQAAAGFPAQQPILQLAAIGDGGLIGLHRDILGSYGIYRTTGSSDTWILDNGGLSESRAEKIGTIGSGGNGAAYAFGSKYRAVSQGLAPGELGAAGSPGPCHLCGPFSDRGTLMWVPMEPECTIAWKGRQVGLNSAMRK